MRRLSDLFKTTALASALLCAGPALADEASEVAATAAHVQSQLSGQFSKFAGSEENAAALVSGLRQGREIVFDDGTVLPPSGQTMGYGEVKISLALAEAILRDASIEDPTPEQIAAVLGGGTIDGPDGPITYEGILTQRAAGQGWGEIAQNHDLKLGHAVSAVSGRKGASGSTGIDAAAQRAQAAKAQRPERLAKAQRAHKVERPMKIERPVRLERPVRIERPVRPERPFQ